VAIGEAGAAVHLGETVIHFADTAYITGLGGTMGLAGVIRVATRAWPSMKIATRSNSNTTTTASPAAAPADHSTKRRVQSDEYVF
jgi:hypothetical protein